MPLSACLSRSVSAFLLVCVALSVCLCLFACLPVCLSVFLSVSLTVCLSVCLSLTHSLLTYKHTKHTYTHITPGPPAHQPTQHPPTPVRVTCSSACLSSCPDTSWSQQRSDYVTQFSVHRPPPVSLLIPTGKGNSCEI